MADITINKTSTDPREREKCGIDVEIVYLRERARHSVKQETYEERAQNRNLYSNQESRLNGGTGNTSS